MACSPPKEPAEYVSPGLVGRKNAVADDEGIIITDEEGEEIIEEGDAEIDDDGITDLGDGEEF